MVLKRKIIYNILTRLLIKVHLKYMDEKELMVIADKIKNKTATEEEILAFTEEFNKVLGEMKEDLSKE